jgi:hypothetical protein
MDPAVRIHFAFPLAGVADPEPVFLTAQSERRGCAFCDRSEPDAKFEKVAHVLPEAFGNHWLFSRDECDDCNAAGSKLERELSKFLLPDRLLSHVVTPQRRPELRFERRGSTATAVASAEKRQLALNLTHPDAPAGAADVIRARYRDDGTFEISFKQPAVDLHAVARALARMGLFVTGTASAAGRCTLAWVRGEVQLVPRFMRLRFEVPTQRPLLVLYEVSAVDRWWPHVLVMHGFWGLAMGLPDDDYRVIPIEGSRPFLASLPFFISAEALDAGPLAKSEDERTFVVSYERVVRTIESVDP